MQIKCKARSGKYERKKMESRRGQSYRKRRRGSWCCLGRRCWPGNCAKIVMADKPITTRAFRQLPARHPSNFDLPDNHLHSALESMSLFSISSLCTKCARRVLQVPRVRARYSTSAALRDRPFRVAVIGSGPAGFYAAYRLLSKSNDAVVDMYEQLPVPFGLVRYGVAPDHPEVKVFRWTSPRWNKLIYFL